MQRNVMVMVVAMKISRAGADSIDDDSRSGGNSANHVSRRD